MSLIRSAELTPRTDRYRLARTWPDRAEAAIVHIPVAARPPTWTVYRRTGSGWVRIAGPLTAGDYLAWTADDLRCESDDAVPAVVAGLLDGMEDIGDE